MADDDKTTMSDVAKPGTTPASATSRPIIVNRTAAVADPMVSTSHPERPAVSPSNESSGSMKSRIEPTKAAEEVQKEATKENEAVNAATEPIVKEELPDSQARLGEIIESGEYNVSIKQKNASSMKTFFVSSLTILLVAAVVLFLLVDLKIIDLGIKLPFELFK